MSLQDELQNTQSAITCSQLTIETLEQVLTYVQSSQKKPHQNDVNDIGLVSLYPCAPHPLNPCVVRETHDFARSLNEILFVQFQNQRQMKVCPLMRLW